MRTLFTPPCPSSTWGAMFLRHGQTAEALEKLTLAYDAAQGVMPYKMTLNGTYYKVGVAHLQQGKVKQAK